MEQSTIDKVRLPIRDVANDGYMSQAGYSDLGTQTPWLFGFVDSIPLDRKDRQIICREIGNTAIRAEYRALSAFTRVVIWLDDKCRGTLR